MKRTYNYVNPEDVTACKELIRTLIKRDKKRCCYRLNEGDAHDYAYQAAKFFDVMQCDFREDLEEWALEEIEKVEAVHYQPKQGTRPVSREQPPGSDDGRLTKEELP